MQLRHRVRLAVLAGIGFAAFSTTNVFAQTNGWSTGFEATTTTANPVSYSTGSPIFQDGWDLGGGSRWPRIQTAAEIAAELTAAGLNVGQTVHSGDQALLVTKVDTAVEPGGYFVRDIFPTPNTLDTAAKVTVDFWSRPLTGGAGADPSGTPTGNGKTIGEREGNNFYGVSDANDAGTGGQRIAAVRFGVDNTTGTQPLYGNITERHIDYASDVAGVWTKSGVLWEPDMWYNFRFEIDFPTKTYDFYINDAKANANPINFYHAAATAVKRFFVSRGTNQAGSILDDVSVLPFVAPPLTPGDFDENGMVDGNDFLVWQRDFSVGSLDDWKANFGTSTAAAAAVPEPASLTLAAGIILLGIGIRFRSGRN